MATGLEHPCFPPLPPSPIKYTYLCSTSLVYVCHASAVQVHASAAKAAVDSITRSLALEWGEYGVRVVGVAPGPIKGTAGEQMYNCYINRVDF